jgi:sugar lactone lactonase YvrE
MDILIPGEEWQLVAEGFKFTEGPATDAAGNVFFTDIPNNRIHKIDGDRKVSVFKEDTGGANGLMFGPDGKLYACQNGRKRIVAYGPDGRESVIAEEVESNDLVVSNQGTIYFTDPRNKQVWFISAQGEKRVVDTGIAFPNGILLTPDQSLLVVADTRGRDLFSLQITSNGSLEAKQRYYGMYIPDGEIDSGADGMTVDTKGRIYVTSRFGLHVFDQMGRVVGFISKPENKWLSNVVFGGKELDLLFVTCEDKVYSRKTKARGVLFFQNPVVTPKPCC